MPRSIILTAGNSCFVACPGCYNHFTPTLAETATVIRFANRLHHQLGIEKVTLGGGDPLTRPDITDLVVGLHEIGLRLHLDTVGTAFLRRARIRFMGSGTAGQVDPEPIISRVAQIGIPLDGSTDETVRLFRRHGSAADQIACLDLLHRLDATLCVNTVVHRGNIDDLDAIAERIAGYSSVIRWQLFQFMPSGPLGSRNRAAFEIAASEYEKATESATRWLPDVEVSTQRNDDRKNRYILIDGGGTVWTPLQNGQNVWTMADSNPTRVVHGHIATDEIISVIAELTAAESCGASKERSFPLVGINWAPRQPR